MPDTNDGGLPGTTPNEERGFAELPRIDAARVQSDESARALEAVFRLPDFIARAQHPDLGIDYEVELIQRSRASNIRFSVQLKSAGKGEWDADGTSLKFSIETSRLHYLSRALCGCLIVIYEVSSRRMFFRWVHEIIPELDAKGAEWRTQDTVTIRFPVSEVLDVVSAQGVHVEVGDLYRRIQESNIKAGIAPAMEAAGASAHDKTVLESGRPTDDTVLSTLLTSGIGLVSAGLHRQVLHAYSRMPSITWSSEPRHLLTIAYAYEHCGQSLHALTQSTAALRFYGPKQLSSQNAALAEVIQIKSRLNIGLIPLEEYYQELSALTARHPDTPESRGARLELILWSMVCVRKDTADVSDPTSRMMHLYAEAKQIVGPDADSRGVRAQWSEQLLLAKIEFQLRNHLFMDGALCIGTAQAMGHPIPVPGRAMMAQQAMIMTHAAMSRLQHLAEAAKADERPDLQAVCQYEMVANQLNFLVISRFIETQGEADSTTDQDSELRRLQQYIEDAISVFSRLGLETFRIRSLRLKADVLNAQGGRDDALAVLGDLRQEILDMGLNPNIAQLTELPAKPVESEIDGVFDDASDAFLERVARDVVRSLRLPESRLGNVITDMRWLHRMRIERRSWCKHIVLLQDLGHTRSRETLYAADPDRHCKCSRYSYESAIGSTEVDALISAFKSTYCRNCSSRET